MGRPELSKLINELVDICVEVTGRAIPKESTKNSYTKCCWLLSQYQWIYAQTKDEKILDMINTIKQVTPLTNASMMN